MSDFLTVKEAARLAGKSPSSIRRVIYPIIRVEEHPDRKHIEPSPAEASKLRTKGENFAWRLSEELLRRETPIGAATEKADTTPSHHRSPGDTGDLLAMLRGELEIKNRQIAQHGELIGKQMELINGLSERLREGNILIGSLQQRLALTDGRERSVSELAKTTSTAQAGKGSEAAVKKPKPKRSFLSRLFS